MSSDPPALGTAEASFSLDRAGRSKAQASEHESSSENRILGKYELIREIGRGAMAAVHLARDTFTDREVAVKVAHPDTETNDKKARIWRKLFLNEAKAAGMLDHPNIVAIYDAGVHDAYRYIVMEYVQGGKTLYSHTRREALLPIEEVVSIVLKCAIAFDYAHRKGVVHRDIKPKNILLTHDRDIKISDFGVALLTEVDAEHTQVTGYVGSPLYMSPEQIRGEPINNQADLFSLGLVMYEMLCGRHPFGANTVERIVHKISREPHVPVHELRPEVPKVLSQVVDRTLKKHPAGRYGMGMDLAGDLSLIFDHLSLSEDKIAGQQRFSEARELEFFSSFSDAEVWEVLNASVWQKFGPGTEILIPNETLESFYVLVRGRVDIRHGSNVIDSLEAGSCFGELGQLPRAERNVWVVTRTATTVMQIRSNLANHVSESARLALHRAFLDGVTIRLARATDKLGGQQIQ